MYSIFVCPKSMEPWLKKNGANDSKVLTAESREAFFDLLLQDKDAESLSWRAKLLHPEYISNCMLKKEKFNLNELSYETVFSIVRSLLEEGIKIKEAYVDTLGKAEKYQAMLEAKFPSIKFTVRSKADSLFPVVGAASIVAKVIRDDVLERVYCVNASGYPGDSATVSYLNENSDEVFGFSRIVRFSWSSCNDILAKRCCKVAWHDEDEDELGKENKAIGGKRKAITTTNTFPSEKSWESCFGFSACNI